MGSEQRVIRLNQTDAITLVRLLDGYERLLRTTELDEGCRDQLGGTVMATLEPDGWQPRLAGEVAAAAGAIRQLLDGYDPSTTIIGATPAEGPPDVQIGAEG